jgi:hypothetical protein
MKRYSSILLLSVALVASLTTFLLLGLNPDTVKERPYPLWHNGQLSKIRNCERPKTEEALLLCASYYCEQAVSRKLVTPQQSTLVTDRRDLLAAEGQIRVSGKIEYYQIRSPSLPYGYECAMDRFDRATPSLLFRSK